MTRLRNLLYKMHGPLVGLCFLAIAASAVRATPPNTITGSFALCSPWDMQNCAIPDASGNLPVTIAGSSGGVNIQGNVASGATDSGNPVKTGGKYNTTLPTFTNGQRGDTQINSRGATLIDNAFINNGTAISVNNGVTDGGTQRIAISSDSNGLIGTGTAGTPSAQVVSVQGIAGGAGQGVLSQYPVSATGVEAVPITASATGTTAATVANLPGTSGKTTYICGYKIDAAATAAAAVDASITGVITGTMTRLQGVGVSPAVVTTYADFTPCVPASAANTQIQVASGAAGAGGQTRVTAYGFQR